MKVLYFIWRFVRKSILVLIVALVITIILLFATLLVPGTALSDRDWLAEQAVIPTAEFEGDLVHVRNIRNFTWRTPEDYDINYYDKTYDVSKLKKVYFVYTPFSNLKPLAHTFITFEFEGPEYLSVSVEVRKEHNEAYGWFNGLFKQYELYYVVADERDTIGYRVFAHKNPVYMYPVKTTEERAKKMFIEALTRANKLASKPEFYHTFFNNCTTNLVRHVNTIVPGRISPLSIGVIFPGYADTLVYKLGLIDTGLSFEEAQKQFYINDRANEYVSDPNFSTKIRNVP